MSNIHALISDPITVVLLVLLSATVVLPVVFVTLKRVTNLPVQTQTFRSLYFAWACLLAGSSVWNISRDVRYSINEAGSDNYIRLAFLMLGMLVILLLVTKYRFGFVSELVTGVLGIFFLFALWGGMSTAWSVSPASSLYKSFEYISMILLFALASYLVTSTVKGPREQLLALKSIFDWNWFLIFMSLVVVYVGIPIWPSIALQQVPGVLSSRLQGALPAIAANGVGQLAAILAAVALTRVLLKPGSRTLYVPLLGFSLVTMLLAQSRSPILAFFLAAVVIMVASRRFGLLLFSGVLGAGVLLSVYGQDVYAYLDRGQSTESLTTLTGRTTFWQTSLQAMPGRWLTGYGANAGGRYILDSMGDSSISTVHSTYVETLVDTGAIGVLLLAAGLLVTWFWLIKLRPYVVKDPISRMLWIESLGVMMVITVRSVFSVAFVWSSTVLTFGVLIVFVTVMRRHVDRRRYAGTAVAQPLPATRRRRPSVRL